ncbi:MAG TPA: metallophosphoesterase, partial [Planctomycetota bacterium]|nr:metallophosphoesterase [Planctomycetota bacterium]
ADGKDQKRPSWALLSDTHIHESLTEENQGQNMASNLLRALSDVLPHGPGTAVVNGDIARLVGNTGDYASFLKLVEPLRAAGVPIHATLGNHDDRDKFLGALEGSGEPALAPSSARAAVAQRHCSSFIADGVRWLLLDSLEKVNQTPGILGPAQLDWVARELDASPREPAILFLHHNVEKSGIGLRDTDDLLAVLRPRRQAKAVFFGHTHTWRRWEDEGIHMVNLPAVGYTFAAAEPIGWVLAQPREDGLDLELRSFGPHQEHGKKVALAWRPLEAAARAL